MELNILDGFFTNYIAVGVFLVEIFVQVILTEFAKEAFSLHEKVNINAKEVLGTNMATMANIASIRVRHLGSESLLNIN